MSSCSRLVSRSTCSPATIDSASYALGQVVIALQLMTHYANDYFDYAADRANRGRPDV